MAWTTLDNTDAEHDAGKPLTKDLFIDPAIDNLNYLYDEVALSIPEPRNGSFENGTVGAGQTPTGWTWTPHTGGTREITSSALEQSHGQNSFKILHPDGPGNGGGTLATDDFIPCSTRQYVYIAWEMKVSAAAGAQNKVRILWYQKDQTASGVSTESVIFDDTAGPTSWVQCFSGAQPPSDATFFKIELNGGDSATDPTAPVDIFFDNVRIVRSPSDVFQDVSEFTVAETTKFIMPATAGFVWVEAIGGGAGGHGTGGGSGGGGEYAADLFYAAASTSYAVLVGAGGSAQNNGADSTFNSTTVDASGGVYASPGTGGTGGSGVITIAGGAATSDDATGGAGARGGGGSTTGVASSPGGGAGEAGGGSAAGAAGMVRVWFNS